MIKSILRTKASEELEKEVAEELKIEDPDKPNLEKLREFTPVADAKTS